MAQLKTRRKKSVALIAAAGLTVAGTGVAFAYWTAQGTGEGTATTGEAVALVITSDAPVGNPLAPGSTPGQAIAFHVNNPGDGAERLAQVSVRVATATGGAWTTVPGCSAADYSVAISTTPAPATIAPGATVDGVATITMNNLNSNQDACQGEDVPLYFDTVVLN